MDLAKQIRINRIFHRPTGRLCSLAVDHFMTYQKGLPRGLTDVPRTLARALVAEPDAVTMMKGMAKSAWAPFAGRCALIVGSVALSVDDSITHVMARPEEVLRLGADAISVAIGVRGPREDNYLRILSQQVEEADRIGLPVVAHIYPRDFTGEPRIVHDPENVMWALRVGIECGADVIKIPFTGDAESFREIVDTSPVPVVAAGGPQSRSLREALQMMTQVLAAGARGATIGRNIWGTDDPAHALYAFKAVLHDNLTPDEAIDRADEFIRIVDA